ncbi:Glycosyl hydrolase family 43A [Hyphodiscus hymeniophilus]|uniref:Glycosyl hydrolase family 43A n=1 Tax=Hyphodiscus hymeniophilus TaxID=353542 RepID=A0A9P6VCI5_9HELO|nr:Glycosyl hydrolase family 43A [Hyphodiscus hymeniophilus]
MPVSNPILPGFFPDPSCIKVGSYFYLANSSFQFFPGIPIHKSKDLVNWTHIELLGNVLCRPSQLNLNQATTRNTPSRNEIFTGGLFAPTIRYHKATFYIFCTNLYLKPQDAPDGDYFPQNFFITSTNLQDPSSFSDPILYEFYGIDPSVYFDLDDRVYVQGSFLFGYDRSIQATTISQAEIDIKTGKLLSPIQELWKGHSGVIPEGPHIYRKDGYYYLLVAEGGTFDGHMLTIARAKNSIWGPYEPCPHNPVIRANNTVCPLIQRVGHGELVYDDITDTWWALVLATRSGGRSRFPLGRETFLTSVEWPDGDWPQFTAIEENLKVRPPLLEVKVASRQLDQKVLLGDPKTIFLRTPKLTDYRQDDDKLLLKPTEENLSLQEGTMTFLGQRQYQLSSHASVVLLLADLDVSKRKSLRAGITVYKDTNRHCSLFLEIMITGEIAIAFEVEAIDVTAPQRLASVFLPQSHEAISLTIIATPEKYEFFYSRQNDKEKEKLGEADGSVLTGNDFTGAVYAIFASGSWDDSVAFRGFVTG